ncbi:Glyoxalase/bleomycin resistance protein/dioxygenase [marine gamma proteobacterium HTCC2080]|nr:Glyoxalase/bleomycin resistance protein/dioxygenase [marine gamma proteobacterium HTCC2080]
MDTTTLNTHTTTIDHLVIAVSDLAKASADLGLLLGRSPSWQGSHPDYGTANTLFKLDNTYIELLAIQGSGIGADAVAAMLQSRQHALGGLVFGTENTSEFLANARNAGLAVSDPAPSHGIDDLSGNTRRWSNMFWDAAAARGFFLSVYATTQNPTFLRHRSLRWLQLTLSITWWYRLETQMLQNNFMASNWVFASRWNRRYRNGEGRSSFFAPVQ